jgi:hypothetical protein
MAIWIPRDGQIIYKRACLNCGRISSHPDHNLCMLSVGLHNFTDHLHWDMGLDRPETLGLLRMTVPFIKRYNDIPLEMN